MRCQFCVFDCFFLLILFGSDLISQYLSLFGTMWAYSAVVWDSGLIVRVQINPHNRLQAEASGWSESLSVVANTLHVQCLNISATAPSKCYPIRQKLILFGTNWSYSATSALTFMKTMWPNKLDLIRPNDILFGYTYSARSCGHQQKSKIRWSYSATQLS